ncbi:4-hydroxythreonine-4-phosphate dehydrogenase [Campylobacter sp.]|uniref:4-hydroxythreonine-4-phosphate dehydrogenase n=1 Tax=Campylobacter sp. TaxID=205 RepID=UPI0026DD5D6A|nr:4-hydroxythreonine-4-phosphate dehydrogenase [Campylobacter sp.]MDO4674238.1 4-hydroxythreonine-4-phosphate dehydrogenase [Campylobacter sp.]
MKPKLAISVGDLNGVGLEILARSHQELVKFCEPYYFLHENLLSAGLKILGLELENARLVFFEKAKEFAFSSEKKTKKFQIFHFSAPLSFEVGEKFPIKPGKLDVKSGLYSFLSFEAAVHFVAQNHAQALLTLPIHKKAWDLAGVKFRGHTQFLGHFFKKEPIMMLGCKKLFVGLFTEHIPLSCVSKRIEFKALSRFLLAFHQGTRFKKIGVLGLNPHAGDGGIIGGGEELVITEAISFVNAFLKFSKSAKSVQNAFLKTHKITAAELFEEALRGENLRKNLQKNFREGSVFLPQPLVADTAFTKMGLKHCNRLVALYHDLALAPLKALYFEESINVSLNLPIIRTSVDHGTAFDKAYKNGKISTKSYLKAAKYGVKFCNDFAREF